MDRQLRSVTIAAIGAVIAILPAACSFHTNDNFLQTPEDVYRVLNSAPYTTTSDSDRWTVSDDGKIRIQQGYACAMADRAATSDYIGIRVQEAADVPPNDEATVIMNGWNLEYQ